MDRPTVLLLASMLVRLRGLLGEFELRPRSLAESSGASLALDLDPSQVTRLLRSALSELPDYRLRALLHETDPERVGSTTRAWSSGSPNGSRAAT